MKIQPNPAALEAMARAGYEHDLQNLPVTFGSATWEQLAPTMREKWMNATARILQPYLDALPAEGLDEHALEIAQQSSRHMPVSDGFKTMARHLVTTYELHRQTGTRAAPPVAPPGAAEIMKNSSVREAHEIETRQNAFTREEWLRCTCGWTSAKVLAEGMDWKTEKLRHIEDALTEE